MKKQSNRSIKGFWLLSIMLTLLGMNTVELSAQEIIRYGTKDIVVTSGQDDIYVVLQGGDGGKNTRAAGGRGATVTGVLKIGTDAGMIYPGSTLRFIAGAAGESSNDYDGAGGGGGGASALMLKLPGASEWNVVAVAGGGGGASWIYYGGNDKGYDGGEGKTSTTGMESNPSYSFSYIGGGYNKSDDENACGGKAGMVNGSPEWVAVESGCSMKGGGGFGSGASGKTIPAHYNSYYGGGGGGYIGGYVGGSGLDPHYDNGGGSWTSQVFISGKKTFANGTTKSPQDGYAMYTFEKEIKFTYNTNKCITDYNSGTSNGNNIQTKNCMGTNDQMWVFHLLDRSMHSRVNYSKCLDLTYGNTSNGTNIQLWDCNGAAAQKWVYNGLYKTIHSGVNSDKCIDAKDAIKAVNLDANLQLWDCNYSNKNQKWNIDGATTVSDVSNKKHIIPVYATSYAVHSHTGAESGSNIQLWTKDDTNTAEQWYFDGLAIKMRDHQTLCIDLSHGNTSNGNNIQLYNCNGTNAQKWLYDGMTQSIRSVVNPDKCMQIMENADGVYGKRSNVEIHDCNESVLQKFLIQD